MNWLFKIAAFKVMAAIPGGEAFHSLLQTKVTKGLAPSAATIREKADIGAGLLETVEAMAGGDSDDVRQFLHIDIGAGWMPTIPLLFFCAGFDRQLLCDVRPNLEIERVAQVVQQFRRLMDSTPQLARFCRQLPSAVERGELLDDYLNRLGIAYAAPYRLSDITAPPGPKIITSTQALLHVPRSEMLRIFEAVATALRDGGLFIATTHLYDIYSQFDKSLSPYNKWRYSDFVWEKLINSKMMSFNRLTARDYRELLEASGLEIVQFELAKAGAEDLAKLRATKIHPKFKDIPESELAARTVRWVARSPVPSTHAPG